MLRSLDPATGFTSPKSKKLEPSKGEESKFSGGEIQSIRDAIKNDQAVRVRRHVAKKQREAALADMQGS